MVGDGGDFGRAGNSWKGTLLGTGGGSQVVDVLRRSFLAFIGCLTCCSSTHSTQPAEVGLQKPLVPSEVTPFLWALPSFQEGSSLPSSTKGRGGGPQGCCSHTGVPATLTAGQRPGPGLSAASLRPASPGAAVGASGPCWSYALCSPTCFTPRLGFPPIRPCVGRRLSMGRSPG